MDQEFWHQRWQNNQIGFHEPDVNPLLAEYFDSLELATGSRVLVPLCGKSHDLTWLANQGYDVIGVELSTLAAESFFKEQNNKPTITELGKIRSYITDNITILVGDIFNVTEDIIDTILGATRSTIHAIYDRAALVALPESTRPRYTKHLIEISHNAKQLLISYQYDQSLMDGPPFSISDNEIIEHYNDCYDISLIKSQCVETKLKGLAATEKVWTLQKKI